VGSARVNSPTNRKNAVLLNVCSLFWASAKKKRARKSQEAKCQKKGGIEEGTKNAEF